MNDQTLQLLGKDIARYSQIGPVTAIVTDNLGVHFWFTEDVHGRDFFITHGDLKRFPWHHIVIGAVFELLKERSE